jgi:hypothetical protein
MPCAQGDLLRRKIALAAPVLHASSTRFWEHERLPELFPKFLVAIHGSVRATVPMMTAAMAASRNTPDARLGVHLHQYFEQHIAEEVDHEEWLLQDLEVLGISREAVLAQPGAPAIAALVGAQYYWIHHGHPVALLGFFAVLEGHPPTIEHLEDVRRRTGLPREAFRMLQHHAELDVVHGDELFSLIDRLPLERSHVEVLGISALHTIGALGDLFQSLVNGHVSGPPATTARAGTEP